MKKLLILFIFPCLLLAQSDPIVRETQQVLSAKGFYFGELDGIDGQETSAAIRRFQIRNGLEVTGQLNAPTQTALGLGSAAPRTSVPPPVPSTPSTETASTPSPVVVQKDREFLQKEISSAALVQPRPPSAAPLPENAYAQMFQNSPFASAPVYVQQDTLRLAQLILRDWGYYRAGVDGIPGPATRQAIANAQRDLRYRVTGTLDTRTLGRMNLLLVRGPVGDRMYYEREYPPVQTTFSFGAVW